MVNDVFEWTIKKTIIKNKFIGYKGNILKLKRTIINLKIWKHLKRNY